jgi:hypothetical protein
MTTLRERVAQLAAEDPELKPHLDRMLVANKTDFVRATIAALAGWSPTLGRPLNDQLATWLLRQPAWVRAAKADMRDAHRQDFKYDWADWIYKAVNKWVVADRGRTKGLKVLPRRLDYDKVVKGILRKLDAPEPEPDLDWSMIEMDLARLVDAVKGRDAAMTSHLVNTLAHWVK